MKLLLVDNDSDTLIELRALCDAFSYDVVTTHCSTVADYNSADFDLIVLSGGFWYDDELKHIQTYAAELELIRTSTTSIIGVCLGMQLMHVAFSGIVPLLDEPQTGVQEISLTPLGQTKLGLPEHIQVHKNHTRGVITALEHFDVLGVSPGHLEVMLHKSRPLLGMQFHPELEQAAIGKQLMGAMIHAVTLPS